MSQLNLEEIAKIPVPKDEFDEPPPLPPKFQSNQQFEASIPLSETKNIKVSLLNFKEEGLKVIQKIKGVSKSTARVIAGPFRALWSKLQTAFARHRKQLILEENPSSSVSTRERIATAFDSFITKLKGISLKEHRNKIVFGLILALIALASATAFFVRLHHDFHIFDKKPIRHRK